MSDGRTEEHHDRRERRGAEARVERGEQNRRRQGHRQPRKHREVVVVGNERADRTGVDGAAERADQIIDRRLERAADADLRQDDGGEHRPQRNGEIEQLCRRQGEDPGRRTAQA